jgi:hypothetical protein
MVAKAGIPENSIGSMGGMPDLVALASSILKVEAPGTYAMPSLASAGPLASAASDVGARICPITGASAPLPSAGQADLRRQAHELVASLLGILGQKQRPTDGGPAAVGYPGGGEPVRYARAVGGQTCPVTKASVPTGAFDLDAIRRQAHGFIETLLVTFNDTTGEKGLPAEDQVPLILGAAPVSAGSEARAMLVVTNEEPTPSDVSLYCSNFISDSGYEIPSLRVGVTPRRAMIAVGGKTTFEIKVAVPQQAPQGNYSALIQAMGCKYVKAVLSIEVS